MSKKRRTRCARGGGVRRAAGNAWRSCCLEEAGMNSLARGISQFQVFIQFRSHGGGSTGNRWRSPVALFFRMKHNRLAYILVFISVCLRSFLRQCICRGDSVSYRALGHATPTDLAGGERHLGMRCVPARAHTPPNPEKKKKRNQTTGLPSDPKRVDESTRK